MSPPPPPPSGTASGATPPSLAGLPTSTGTASMGSTTDCTVTCTISDMPTFTVNFRRPEADRPNRTASISSTSHYDGSYGFDWLRDEYIYNLKRVYEIPGAPFTRLYQGDVSKLLDEYLNLRPTQPSLTSTSQHNGTSTAVDNTLTEAKKIKTALGMTYIPSWLAIFPSTDPVNTRSTDPANINTTGVDLYLEVEQEAAEGIAITAFNTSTTNAIEIKFEADTGITVLATGIATLTDLVSGATAKDEHLKFTTPAVALAEASAPAPAPISNSNLPSKEVKRYKDINKKINIIATTGSNDVRFVKVIAKDTAKNCSRIVGLLCIYPNGAIKQSDITVVPTIIPRRTVAATPLNRTAVDTRIQKQFLNQANIYANITTDAVFDISVLNNADRTTFDTEMTSYGLTTHPTRNQEYIFSNQVSNAHDSIVKLYGKTNSLVLNDDDDGEITYLFFTNYTVVEVNSHGWLIGSTPGNTHADIPNGCTGHCAKPAWGNTTVIYQDGLTRLDTVAHELGHSFSLPHTFSESKIADIDDSQIFYLTHHTFYRGYTDNLMDYLGRSGGGSNTYMRIALFKWQWNIIRDDQSIN